MVLEGVAVMVEVSAVVVVVVLVAPAEVAEHEGLFWSAIVVESSFVLSMLFSKLDLKVTKITSGDKRQMMTFYNL